MAVFKLSVVTILYFQDFCNPATSSSPYLKMIIAFVTYAFIRQFNCQATGTGTGIGDWDWGLGKGEWENWKWETERVPQSQDMTV